MSDLSPPPPRRSAELPSVLRLSFAAYAVTLQRFGHLATAAAVPFALSVSAYFLPASVHGVEAPLWKSLPPTLLIHAFAATLFAVAWIRALLLDDVPSLWPRIARQHLRFFLRLLPLLLVLVVCWMPPILFVSAIVDLSLMPGGWGSPNDPGFIPFILIFIFFLIIVPLVGTYLVARCSLVLPASALDRRFGFGGSWRNTSENAWKIIGAYIFFPGVLISILFALFIGIYYSYNPIELFDLDVAILLWFIVNLQLDGVMAFALFVVFTATGYYFMAALAAVLSFVFRDCVVWVPEDEKARSSVRDHGRPVR